MFWNSIKEDNPFIFYQLINWCTIAPLSEVHINVCKEEGGAAGIYLKQIEGGGLIDETTQIRLQAIDGRQLLNIIYYCYSILINTLFFKICYSPMQQFGDTSLI